MHFILSQTSTIVNIFFFFLQFTFSFLSFFLLSSCFYYFFSFFYSTNYFQAVISRQYIFITYFTSYFPRIEKMLQSLKRQSPNRIPWFQLNYRFLQSFQPLSINITFINHNLVNKFIKPSITH